MKQCKCIKEAKLSTLGAGDKAGQIVTFSINNMYTFEVIAQEYWGDCYKVTDGVTGFTAKYNKTKFDEFFQEVNE